MLTMKAKYALKALEVLAKSGAHGSRAIAEKADVPHKFLESILQELKRHDVVKSRRGIFGGYVLAKPAEEIYLGNVIRIIDGPLAPIRCASVTAYQKCEDCLDENTCAIKHVMFEVRNAISGVLDKKTLKEFAGI